MKICTKCKIEKDLTNFYKSSSKKDGLQNTCKSCMKVSSKSSYDNNPNIRLSIKTRTKKERNRIRNFLQRYKRYCGCKICGEKEPVALDFHHLDPTQKDFGPTTLVDTSMNTAKSEIRKCIVLCSNCHRKVHAGILTI